VSAHPDLSALQSPEPVGPGRFAITIPDGWQQGRGAFGGLVIGMLARAIERFEDEPERAIRSITAELGGPALPGPASIVLERQRAGSSVSVVTARLEQPQGEAPGNEVQAHAVAVLGRARRSVVDHCELPTPAPITARPWRDVEPFPWSEAWPPFARHVEFRCTGPMPFSGGPEAIAEGWVRFRETPARRDVAHLAALADGWWPALFSTWTMPRQMATIAYTLQVLGDLDGLDPEAPIFHRARAVASKDGYVVELRELWGEDGRLLALNEQTFVVIR
jgi:hypothetical protein